MKVMWKYYRHSTSIKKIIIKEREREREKCFVSKQIWTTSSKMPLSTRTNETLKWTYKIVNVF